MHFLDTVNVKKNVKKGCVKYSYHNKFPQATYVINNNKTSLRYYILEVQFVVCKVEFIMIHESIIKYKAVLKLGYK